MSYKSSHLNRSYPWFCACLAILLLAGCATGENSTVEGDVAGEGETASASKRECRTTGASGTKMKTSICRTAEQWALVDARHTDKNTVQDEFFRRVRENAALGSGPSLDSPTGGGL